MLSVEGASFAGMPEETFRAQDVELGRFDALEDLCALFYLVVEGAKRGRRDLELLSVPTWLSV